MENVHSSGHSPVSQIATYFVHSIQYGLSSCFEQSVLLGPHQDLWLCDLLSDGWHEQSLNEVVEAFAVLLPIFSFNSFPFFIMIQVFTVPFPSVSDLCSLSKIFVSH